MASFTLTSPSRFPNGTSVAAYPLSNWNGAPYSDAAPVGSSTTSGSVSGGSVTFSGLADETRYVAYASVGGEHRYVRFSTKRTHGLVRSEDVTDMVVLTQSEYDAISSPDSSTLYVIQG